MTVEIVTTVVTACSNAGEIACDSSNSGERVAVASSDSIVMVKTVYSDTTVERAVTVHMHAALQ